MSNYVSKTYYAEAHDGQLIPLTITMNKKYLSKTDKQFVISPQKCLIKSYGCYGLNSLAGFNIIDWSLLERDWIIVNAHIRGGSEKGVQWHNLGRLEKKHDSV
jgi:oligopeptidase B